MSGTASGAWPGAWPGAWIVTANRLGDGAVVYLGAGDDWTETFAAARIAHDKAEADAWCAEAARPDAELRVVGPYIMAVAEDQGWMRPTTTREWIRAGGPSVGGGTCNLGS